MLAVIRGIAVKVHQLQRTAGIRTYFAGIEVARLVQRLEDDLLRWKGAVVEGRLHGVEIVRSDGHQVATTTDVQMQFVLQIEEAGKLREMVQGHLLVVHVVVHVNVAKNSAHDIGTNQLPLKKRYKHHLRVLLDKYLNALLLRLREMVLLQNKQVPNPLPELPRFP